MGKGDKKTAKGKRFKGSAGKSRLKPTTPAFVAAEKPKEEAKPKASAKKTTAKKTTAKKTTAKKAPAKKEAETKEE